MSWYISQVICVYITRIILLMFIWIRFKEGKPVKSKTITYENRVAKYEIKECVESTTATYTCKASNSAGTAETSCKLTVQGNCSYKLVT